MNSESSKRNHLPAKLLKLSIQALVLCLSSWANAPDEIIAQRNNHLTFDARRVVSIAFCELVNHPAIYNGRVIQVKASRIGWSEGAYLYDLSCDTQEHHIDPEFECPSDKECTALQKALDKRTVYNSNLQGRVEAILIGRFVALPAKLKDNFQFSLYIQKVKHVRRISHNRPWPKGSIDNP